MEDVYTFLKKGFDLLNFTIFNFGSSKITIGMLLYLLIAITLLFVFTKILRKFIVERLVVRVTSNESFAHSVGNIFRYTVIFIGLVVIFQSSGVNLSALTVVAGALSVGVGFGLQNITNNFISGLVILFERPIKVGDRVEVPDLNNLAGTIMTISARSTTILTNDNIAVIVPNSKFISETVINWSYNDTSVRFAIPVGVSYKEDPEVVRSILLKVATENPHVLKTPEPEVLLESYGDSSINFLLRVYTSYHSTRPLVLSSEIYFELFAKFKQQGVEIPFPQRDVHIIDADGHINSKS
ncbi:MAG TPA: mechanosensitive ion channel domain-containing protein [Williamwhitmania sp.]|nr:mechanosensitive ion channel domain-containing protein [Williamwhitmania sp.]